MQHLYGPFRPDSSGLNEPFLVDCNNLRPDEKGYRPVNTPVPSSDALSAPPQGAVTVLNDEGGGETFAGTATTLEHLQTDQTWTDVTRLTGGPYATPVNTQWGFIQFGSLVIANNSIDVLQKFDVGNPLETNFQALGGSPPTARYMGTVGGFVMLSNITGGTPFPARLQWSGLNDAEEWSDVTKFSDFQDLVTGGPAGPIVSGEVGYVLQRNIVRRMIFTGGPEIFQIEEMETGRGTEAPNSLVQTGRFAFYLGLDGFYALDTDTGRSIPIGEGKMDIYFRNDQRARTDPFVLGGADPTQTLVFWAYVSNNTSGNIPDKVLIYDWGKGEFGRGTFDVLSIAAFITQGFNLDQLGQFGDLDSLPFSLDSPFWSSGRGVLSLFGTDNRLSTLSGTPLAASLETNDFVAPNNLRSYVNGITPLGDPPTQTISIGTRERQDSNVNPTFGPDAPMEVNGTCSVRASGRYMRVRHKVPAGTDWTQIQGVDVPTRRAGKR